MAVGTQSTKTFFVLLAGITALPIILILITSTPPPDQNYPFELKDSPSEITSTDGDSRENISESQNNEVHSQTSSSAPTPITLDNMTATDSKIVTATPSINSSRAGTITSLELHDLTVHTEYLVDLSSFSFSSLAVSWSEGEIAYSVGNYDHKTAYQPLTPSDDIQSFEENLTSDLLSVDSSEDTALSLLPQDPIKYLKVDLISTEPSKTPATSTSPTLSSTGVYNRDSGAKYTSLSIISRDSWGANPASWDPYSSKSIDDPARFVWEPCYHPVSRIVVHHTATTNNPSDPQAAIRSIYLYHTYSRGWGDIGYNYLIDQYGNIYEGKAGGDEVFGYHAYTEANAMSIGISLLGNFTSVNPTSAAQNSLIMLLAEKAALYDFSLKYSDGSLSKWLSTSYTVFGHRDSWFWCYPGHYYFANPYVCASQQKWAINPTACPGDRLRSLLSSSITPKAQEYKNTHFASLKEVEMNVENALDRAQKISGLMVKFNLPEWTTEAQVLSYIPEFSGITNVIVEKNRAYIEVLDWDSGGVVVPPVGWDGYNAPNTFFPAANGPEDRIRTLAIIFRMDPMVEAVEPSLSRDLF